MTSQERSYSKLLKPICLVSILGMVGELYAFTIDNVADPVDANVTYVGDVVQNGLPLQMKKFKVSSTAAEVLNYYKQRWSDVTAHDENIPSYIEKRVGDWWVLTKIESSSSVVVQVKESGDGYVEGLISVSDLSKRKKPNTWETDFPRISGTQLLSNTESNDNGRQAFTLILVNDSSISENNDYYRSNMEAEGWSYSRGGVNAGVSMLHFVKDNWQCDMTVTMADDGKTVIFANLVELNENS
ncbi:MAG: hypothetical protein ABW098_17710 [Candidatus Thiodiazotropha sp.]